VKYAVGSYALSPDGKEIVSFEVRELDHKLMLRVDNVDSHQMTYSDIDQRALPNELAFTPDGKGLSTSCGRKAWTTCGCSRSMARRTAAYALQKGQDVPVRVFSGWLEDRHGMRRTGIRRRAAAR